MATEVEHRKLRWLGHMIRMEQKRIPKKGLRWNPSGERKQGNISVDISKQLEK